MPSPAATSTVASGDDAGGTCPGGTCTLRQAIAAAAAGDTIDFAPGLAAITLTSGELVIGKTLSIAGPGANLLAIARDPFAPEFRIVHVTGNFNITFSGVTIANG